ncbi:PTS lactose/cellobiose transporter subunit IIA [Clostridiales bacterium TF09-2AC]|uniref:PTS lactose/cellobiose transporter subunit IIA n=1 Tax=Enterocloster hominis (ex Hitch et al. 2024) TaxID=1917870 RepID=A0ABV1D343_9FIRM|nr:lichenan-specific phosphotransferase enzyme IIA component [Clostridiales bacterium 1_7_47FAA]RJW49041.1 PTS lactose/cellobiose transporter subunit IIA [Clostridiales bacterium TF09-2AC]
MEGMELICFQLITAAGAAKSNYITAIQKAKEGLYEEAEKLIEEGDNMMKEGHQPHTELIQKEAAGEDIHMGLILTHAEDQMMSGEVFKIMAEEMIELYKKVNG